MNESFIFPVIYAQANFQAPQHFSLISLLFDHAMNTFIIVFFESGHFIRTFLIVAMITAVWVNPNTFFL
jgi:peptidoglycan biosynthesis protein MviN/MurJ (putative lipid II flippase)